MSVMQRLLVVGVAAMAVGSVERVASHDYDEALEKSILFFEGMRSGKLPPTQRMDWRKDSGLRDGHQIGVDLVGGYYDAGDNLKFHFPMAWSITMLAWSVLEFGQNMGSDLQHALEAIQWGTDYFLKATSIPGFVFAQVGDPYDDHNCWQRPEDMDTPRTPYAVTKDFPGSEVSAETAAALAASSLVFRPINRGYSERLLRRARMVFEFADKYRGSYNESLGQWVCPYYCDYSGYEDELLWGAAWLFRATRVPYYWNYVLANIRYLDKSSFTEFGWDNKHAGINVLVLKLLNSQTPYSISNRFVREADKFVCSMLPESPTVSVSYSPGGLLFKTGGSNMQHTTALSFLLVAYARFLSKSNRVIYCGGNVIATPNRLAQVARSQVDYILGSNPSNMSYMVGYGGQFPRRIHHRGSSLPSINQHPEHISCADGKTYFARRTHNPNELTGAVVGGPDLHDSYADSRVDYEHSEPATYINAPLVGLLAYFTSH